MFIAEMRVKAKLNLLSGLAASQVLQLKCRSYPNMGARESRAVLTMKRIFVWGLLVLFFGLVGGFCALTATNPKPPHPWGEIRLMQYSTNELTAMAHFRFRNLFEWPVFIEIGLELHTDNGWEMARGYSMFVPIEKAVGSKGGQNFVVPVPFNCKEWRVLVRAAKAEFSESDVRRQNIKGWLESHGGRVFASKIAVEDPNGHIMPGPLMKYDKPGRLATAH